ncbi:hypothetical protein PENSPDRAFT_671161 [Peniophora sp. CONT]|nr:hypothetical protein PENSPDRAFT_671161 [Peniophora sp. CONT]
MPDGDDDNAHISGQNRSPITPTSRSNKPGAARHSAHSSQRSRSPPRGRSSRRSHPSPSLHSHHTGPSDSKKMQESLRSRSKAEPSAPRRSRSRQRPAQDIRRSMSRHSRSQEPLRSLSRAPPAEDPLSPTREQRPNEKVRSTPLGRRPRSHSREWRGRDARASARGQRGEDDRRSRSRAPRPREHHRSLSRDRVRRAPAGQFDRDLANRALPILKAVLPTQETAQGLVRSLSQAKTHFSLIVFSITYDPLTGHLGWQRNEELVWRSLQAAWSKVSKPFVSVAGAGLFGTLSFFFSRPLLVILLVLLSWPAPEFYCSYSYEPCQLRMHTESFTNMETRGIGALVNVSHHSFGRAVDLISAATVIDDLRTMAHGRAPVDHAENLYRILEKYRDSLRNTSRALIHVEASVWTLVETASINNQLAYAQLSRSEKTYWFFDYFWPSCSGPRSSDVYRSFSQLLEAIVNAAIGTTRVAYSLRGSLEQLQTLTTALRLLADDMNIEISEDSTDGRILALIWDSMAPTWGKGVLDVSRRWVLSSSRFPELRSFEYLTAFSNELSSLKNGVDLARRSLLSSTSGAVYILSQNDDRDEECPSWSRKDRKPFQSLYSAAYELREMMERILR